MNIFEQANRIEANDVSDPNSPESIALEEAKKDMNLKEVDKNYEDVISASQKGDNNKDKKSLNLSTLLNGDCRFYEQNLGGNSVEHKYRYYVVDVDKNPVLTYIQVAADEYNGGPIIYDIEPIDSWPNYSEGNQ